MAKKVPIVFNETTGDLDELQVGDFIDIGKELVQGWNRTGSTLNKGQAVNLTYHVVSGEMRMSLAKANDIEWNECKGFVFETLLTDTEGYVLTEKELDGFSMLTPGLDYYLSESTAGTMQDIPPTGVRSRIQKLGYAIKPDTLFVKLEMPIKRR